MAGFGDNARLYAPDMVAMDAVNGGVWLRDRAWLARVTAQGDLSFVGTFPHLSFTGLVIDRLGVPYVSGVVMGVIYRIGFSAGQPSFSVVAGVEQLGSTGFADGTGAVARMRQPRQLVYDGAEHFYFIDQGNFAIRRMSREGTVTTVAGQPSNTTSVDGTGSAAGFADPRGLVRMPDGNLLVRDGARWRRVTPQGQVTTLPGTAPALGEILIAASSDAVYGILDHQVVRVALDGTVMVIAPVSENGAPPSPQSPAPGLALTPTGDLIVTDPNQSLLRRITPAGQTVARVGAAPQPGRVDGTGAAARFAAMGPTTTDAAGNLYVLDTERKNVRRITPAGVVSTLFQDFPSDGALAVDASGRFYGVRDRAIVRVNADGTQAVFAGQPGVLGFADGPAASAQFARPAGLAFDANGHLLVGDGPQVDPIPFAHNAYLTYGSTIRRIAPDGTVSTVAGRPGRKTDRQSLDPARTDEFLQPVELAVDAAGHLFVRDGMLQNLRRLASANGTPQVLHQAEVNVQYPAMAVTAVGELYFVEVSYLGATGSSFVTVRRSTGPSTSSVVAGSTEPFCQGVRLGPLPGCLNLVSGLEAGPDGSLYAFSENSVLRIRP